MTKPFIAALAALGILAAWAQPAAADCKSDLAALKGRLAREKDPAVIKATQKHVKRAEIETKGSESECRNEVTRGWRAMADARDASALEAKQAAAKRAR
jgi:hypothetical protein